MAPPPLLPAGVDLQLSGIRKTSKILSRLLLKADADLGKSFTPKTAKMAFQKLDSGLFRDPYVLDRT